MNFDKWLRNLTNEIHEKEENQDQLTVQDQATNTSQVVDSFSGNDQGLPAKDMLLVEAIISELSLDPPKDQTKVTHCEDGSIYVELDRKEFLVLHDMVRPSYVADRIEQDLWAFNPSFLSRYMDLDEDYIEKIQSFMYEDSSPVFRAMIGNNFKELCSEILGTYGETGALLASYDHEEHHLDYIGDIDQYIEIYVYRVN